MESKKKRFVLIDTNSLVHRAFHAFPPELATSKGEQVNAVYGFSSILLTVILELKPDFLVAVFDVAQPTHRHLKFVDYKKNRKPVEKDLILQFPRVKEILRAFNVTIIEVPGFEADDIIGTVVHDKKIKEYQKIIVTGDQDMFQLLDSDTQVYISGRSFKDSMLFSQNDLERKFGLKPNQIVDYKALRGDPSDNIPGVKGIGKTGATELIKKFGDLNSIYKNIEEIPIRYRKKLELSHDEAYLSQDLARIVCDVPLSFKPLTCQWGKWKMETVQKLFQELEFRSLFNRLKKIQEISNPTLWVESKKSGTIIDIHNVSSKKEFDVFLQKLKIQSVFALYVYTPNTHIRDRYPISISFSWNKKSVFIIGVKLIKQNEKFTLQGKQLKDILENTKIQKVGYDMKSSIPTLKNMGIELKGLYFDVFIAACLLRYGRGKIQFSDLCFDYLGINNTFTINEDTQDDSIASLVWSLYQILGKKFEEYKNKSKDWNLAKLFYKIEMPLVSVLAGMEWNGILIDQEYLHTFSQDLDVEIKKVTKQAFKCVGHEFPINSPRQVGTLIFDELALTKPNKTRKGNISSRGGILESLKGLHPVIEHILRYRELSKLRSTYTDSLVHFIHPVTKKIHTSFNQSVTATGRLSSVDPNIQNIPIATELGLKIRRAFISDKDSLLISFDYAQQELRILAHLADEKKLIQAFKNHIDVHALTAAKIFQKELAKVSKYERSIGKTVNFGVMYGMGARGLSTLTKIDYNTAREFIRRYFEEYSCVKVYFDQYLKEASVRGYAETLFGRRRVAAGLASSNVFLKNASIRELTNFPIQGTAADMMKYTMIQVDKLIQTKFFHKAELLLQIHDELIVEYHGENQLENFCRQIKHIMEHVFPMKVPLVVDVHRGKNWAEI